MSWCNIPAVHRFILEQQCDSRADALSLPVVLHIDVHVVQGSLGNVVLLSDHNQFFCSVITSVNTGSSVSLSRPFFKLGLRRRFWKTAAASQRAALMTHRDSVAKTVFHHTYTLLWRQRWAHAHARAKKAGLTSVSASLSWQSTDKKTKKDKNLNLQRTLQSDRNR